MATYKVAVRQEGRRQGTTIKIMSRGYSDFFNPVCFRFSGGCFKIQFSCGKCWLLNSCMGREWNWWKRQVFLLWLQRMGYRAHRLKDVVWQFGRWQYYRTSYYRFWERADLRVFCPWSLRGSWRRNMDGSRKTCRGREKTKRRPLVLLPWKRKRA